MIIGLGFGSPLQSILMLVVTSLLSYFLFKALHKPDGGDHSQPGNREKRRQYYYAQRQRAREYMREFDLADEEIERKLDEEFNK